MRPAHKTISAGRLDSSRAGLLRNLRSRSFQRASELGPSTATVSPKPFRSQASFHSKGERCTSMSNKLYVGNLAFQTTSQELQELFAQAGTVESASVVE